MALAQKSSGGVLEIRPARPQEYDEIGRVTELAFSAGPYGHLPVSDERRALVRDVAARSLSGQVLVAADAAADPDAATDAGGAILGTVTLLRSGTPQSRLARGDEAELRLLAVTPRARGWGIGRALAQAAEEEAHAWGASAVVLDTGARNTVSQALYRSLGYAVINGGHSAADERGSVETPIEHLDFRKGIRRPGDVIVRLVRADEHDAVADLSERAYSLEYEISDGYRSTLRNVAERAREHQVWVATDASDGALLGAVATPRRAGAISPLAREGELDFRLLAVDPPARGRGIGELLTRHVIELARLRGLDHVVMNSGPQMVGAHRLYEKIGFSRMPDREPTIEDGGRSLRLLSFTIAVDGADSERAPSRTAAR